MLVLTNFIKRNTVTYNELRHVPDLAKVSHALGAVENIQLNDHVVPALLNALDTIARLQRKLEPEQKGNWACENCGKVYKSAYDLDRVFPDIPDLAQRVCPGELVPAGECNHCQALVHRRADDNG
jgi:hypothetical protein